MSTTNIDEETKLGNKPITASSPDLEPIASAKQSATEASNHNFRWIILVGLILSAAMEVLDTTIINVSLPQMAGNLGTTTQEIAWVSTGYILSNVVVLPMTAFLNSMFGRRLYLTGSIILFTVSSFFCGTSHSLGEIVIWRILQGAGGAALLSTAQAALVQVFSPKEQAIVQPLFLMGLVVFPTIGPALGGWITDSASWNWCFFINVPVGIIAGTIILFLLKDTIPAKRNVPVDWLGIALMTTALGTLQYVLEEGQQQDWFNDRLISSLAGVSTLAFAAMITWLLSKHNTHPIINLRVLKNRSLSTSILLFVVVGFGLYGVNYLFPLLAQQVQGLSSLQSGLALLPGGIASAVSVVFCGVITSNMKTSPDARILTFIGIILTVIGVWGLGTLGAGSGDANTIWPLLIRGSALGFLFVPVNSLAIGSLKPDEVNEGVSLLGLGRQLGGSIGVAILATALETNKHINHANLVVNINNANLAYNERVNQLAGNLLAHGYNHAQAQAGAIGMIGNILNTQVATMSFNDSFMMLMAISLGMAPLLLLLKKPKVSAVSVPMH